MDIHVGDQYRLHDDRVVTIVAMFMGEEEDYIVFIYGDVNGNYHSEVMIYEEFISEYGDTYFNHIEILNFYK